MVDILRLHIQSVCIVVIVFYLQNEKQNLLHVIKKIIHKIKELRVNG